MRISVIDAGKRFNRDWIFRRLSYEFIQGKAYAITGSNGSGKSTLLQAIGGALTINEGKIDFHQQAGAANSAIGTASAVGTAGIAGTVGIAGKAGTAETLVPTDDVYRYIAIAAPYLELIEEMTVTEFLNFHRSFKPLLPQLSIPQIISRIGLEKAAHKQMRFYSSGMKQRAKLAQAIFSDTPVILLDEPCTNLDGEGIALYQGLVRDYCMDRLVIVSSNDLQEYEFCQERINIMEYKK